MRRIAASRRTLEITSARMVSPTIRHLELRSLDGPLEYLAGQWIKLYLPGEIERDYSIASAPKLADPDRIELLVTRVEGGPGSTFLHQARVGDRVGSLGPNGLFVREGEERSRSAIYIGTGSGLAPLRAMLEQALEHPGPPQLLLFGCRREEDVLFRDAFDALRARDDFDYEVTLSRAGDSWSGRRGYVQDHLRDLLASRTDSHIYVCGLSKMIKEVRRVLKEELGIDRRQIHSERYD